MNIGIIFGQMLVLFAMMAVGFFCYKKGWITEESSGHLSKLVVNLFNPVLVVNGVLGQSSAGAGNSVAWNLVFVVGYFAFLVLVSYGMPFILRTGARLRSMYRLMTIFGNIAFMGIPVLKAVFGKEAMIYVAFYVLGYNIMVYTCGVYLSGKAAQEKHGEEAPVSGHAAFNKSAFLKQFLNPGVAASLLAVIIFAAGMKVPEPVSVFCDYMGNATIPLSMLLIGVSMAQADLKEVFADWRIYVFILIRMLVIPIVSALVLKGAAASCGIDPMVFGIFVVELGMPVGSIIALLVREKGADSAYCTKGIVLSTLASIVTIPVVCMFL